MEKNKKIIEFYMLINKLKDVKRTGWLEVEIATDRVESVAEHIYGCIPLALVIDSEYNLNLDVLKVIKMILFSELAKISMTEFTPRSYPTLEERKEAAAKTIKGLFDGFAISDDVLSLIKEYDDETTMEAKMAREISKIESDMQAKKYDLDGKFDVEKAREDAKYYGEPLSSEIIPQINNASDGWILYDRKKYDELFTSISEDLQSFSNK